MDINGNLFVCKIKIDLIFYHDTNNNLTPNTTNSIKMQSQNETTSSTYETCAICLEEIRYDLFTTKCGHQFHYGCLYQCDKALLLEIYDKELLEALLGNYSLYKNVIETHEDDEPLSCPLCRSPIKSIRQEKQVMPKTQPSLSFAKKKRHYLNFAWCYDTPILTNKFKSQKRNTNSKLRFRRFNK
jgi:hypothetical protein